MVYTLVLGTSAFGIGGSTPSAGIFKIIDLSNIGNVYYLLPFKT